METSELLTSLLQLFQENIPEAKFVRAWPEAFGSRRLTAPLVAGEVDGETVKPGSHETRYKFRIYLPEGEGAEAAEGIFAQMCRLAGEAYPGFSAISRNGADREQVTGNLVVVCTLSFLTADSEGTLEKTVTLGGKTCAVTGVKTTVSRKGEDLISIGETEAFAVKNEETEYTVELTGLDVTGLETLTGFRADLGKGRVYLGCRWKSLSDVLRKAVFVSAAKEE